MDNILRYQENFAVGLTLPRKFKGFGDNAIPTCVRDSRWAGMTVTAHFPNKISAYLKPKIYSLT